MLALVLDEIIHNKPKALRKGTWNGWTTGNNFHELFKHHHQTQIYDCDSQFVKAGEEFVRRFKLSNDESFIPADRILKITDRNCVNYA